MAVVDVVKYEGDNQTFVWKSPETDFNTSTQLIVHETQEAVFFKDGQALDLFGPGRYTLQTQNLPFLNKVINIPTGGESAFHCEVYFVNRTEQMAIGWGTNSKIQYMDPTYNFPLSIGASGEMSMRVSDSRKLLIKLVGTESLLSREKLTGYFRMFLQTRIKSHFVRVIQNKALSIFEMDAYLDEISNDLHSLLKADFEEYGMDLRHFMVTTIVRPESDPEYIRFKELFFRQYGDVKDAEIRQQVEVIDQTAEAKKTVIEAEAIATKRRTEGYTYQQQRGFDVAQQMAQNDAVGEFTNMGIGLGMIGGVGAPVAGMVGGVMQDAVSSVETPLASGVVAGSTATANILKEDPYETLAKLKRMLEDGLIPQEAYDSKVKEVLGRM